MTGMEALAFASIVTGLAGTAMSAQASQAAAAEQARAAEFERQQLKI
ncbi:MAG TPA: hypothetical protein VGU45_11940 [Microvirga sp.]|jgi:hypothetical protein|nr:hypothetical protein [Microvirga sp.]